MRKLLLLCLLGITPLVAAAQAAPTTTPAGPAEKPHIAPNSRVYIEPMEGFEVYLSAAIMKKNVPLVVTDNKASADFIVSGTSHVDKASWAKTIFISGASTAGASIMIKSAKTGDLVFAYAVDKFNSARANQSTAEACAKHLKGFIDKK